MRSHLFLSKLFRDNAFAIIAALALFIVAGLLARPARVLAFECDAAFTTQCLGYGGQVQSGPCDSSGRKYITSSGSIGTLSSLGDSAELMHCGSTAGSYCCALNKSELCEGMDGYGKGEFFPQCLPADTCATADSCMLGGKAYTTYDGKACKAEGTVCCQKLTDALRKDGCVSDSSGSSASKTAPYSETACDAIGGLCGSSCGSFETASPSVTCGTKDGTAYACCLQKNGCSDAGGYCVDANCSGDSCAPSCNGDDTYDAADVKKDGPSTLCQTSATAPKKACCKPTPKAAGSASTDAAKSGSAGSTGGKTGSASGGALITANPFAYKPPVDAKTTIPQLIANITKAVLGVIGAAVFAMFVYAGFLWMIAAGDPKKVQEAQTILRSTVIGMVIIVAAFVLSSNLVRILGSAAGG